MDRDFNLLSVHAHNVVHVGQSSALHLSLTTKVSDLLEVEMVLAAMIMEIGRDLTQSHDTFKQLYQQQNRQEQSNVQHKDATKAFDYTTLADQLRTFSWGDYRHPMCVFYGFLGQTLLFHATAVQSREYEQRYSVYALVV